MTDQALDDLARRVLLDVCGQEYGDVIEELPEHDFSPAFEKKMKKLIRRANHPIRYRAAQAAACLLLAALLSGCTVLAFSPEARAAFVGWGKDIQQKWFSYQYVGEVDAVQKDTIYRPTWLPEGYQEIKSPRLGNFVYALYGNESGSRLSFAYQIGLEEINFYVEREKTQIQHPLVADVQADLFLSTTGRANALVWTDEAKGIVFWITAQLGEKDLVRVAESIQESEPIGWIYRPTWFPPGSWVKIYAESDGEGDTVYTTYTGTPIEFCYSKSGTTPYAGRTDGQNLTLKNGPAMLYPTEPMGAGQILTWSDKDTGYAFWLTSEIPIEDMVRFAESVQIYMHSVDSAFELDTIEEKLRSAPFVGKVKNALTDEFIDQVKECAKRDAAMGVYMSSDYEELKKVRRSEYVSPDRDSAIAQVSNLLENNQSISFNVLCLIEPFCFASIDKSEYGTRARIFDENGTMIAHYSSIDEYTSGGVYANIDEYIDANGYPSTDEYIVAGGLWFPTLTPEEMLYNDHIIQIYADTYRESTAGEP